MGSIIGIPTTRVSDLFVRQRLLGQVQADQLELLRLQIQLSTGRRIQAPSEEADAAQRIISLQRLVERREQIQTNLRTNQSYLTATDTSLSTIANSLAEVRGLALGVLGAIANDTQREAAAVQVQQTIQQLLDAGNRKFRGRHLFAGAGTISRPFETTSAGFVQYLGDERRLSSYSDIDSLFDTNLHGNEVFGAISRKVLGSVDLNPVLTYNTRLDDLRGGLGITPGSIAVSVTDGISRITTTSTIDIANAETIGDVAAMIHANPPGGKILHLEITPTGLNIELDSAPLDRLAIREVGGGTTADELGILTETATSSPIVGDDVDPILRLTTPLDDILGTRPYAVVRSSSPDNDVIIEADTVGDQLNGVAIAFVDDPMVVPGSETVTYVPGVSITIGIDAGYSKARHVVTRINEEYDLGNLPFRARLDPFDEENGGEGFIDVLATGTTGTTGSGIALDKDSGLQIVNEGKTHIISLANPDPSAPPETIEYVLNQLNMSDAGVLAEINEDATGIDIRSRVSGADFMVGENGGTTATELGVRTFTDDTRLDDLNYGLGVDDQEGNGTLALAVKQWGGPNNDLIFRARNADPAWNGFTISFIPGTGTLNYDRVAKTMEFRLTGSATANDIKALVNANPDAAADFLVELHPQDGSPNAPSVNDGNGLVSAGPSVTTAEGRTPGADFVITLGALPSQGPGTAMEIDISANDGSGYVTKTDPVFPPETSGGATSYATATARSIGLDNDLIFQAKNPGTAFDEIKINFEETPGVPAAVTAYDPVGTKELTFGFDPEVSTAQDIIDALQAHAAGADFSATPDPANGSMAETVGDVLDLINQHPDNVDPSSGQPLVQARLATYGNGIELVDLSSGSGEITVTRPILSTAAIGLGLIPEGQQSTSGGTAEAAATGEVVSIGANNDLVFTAVDRGILGNGIQVVFRPEVGGPVTLNYAGNVLTVEYDPLATTANEIVTAAAGDPNFTAALATTDNDGSDTVDENGTATLGGGNVNTLATDTVTFTGSNNDITFSARSPGETLNGTGITFSDAGVGNPITFTHDPVLKTLQVGFDLAAGITAAEIVEAFRADPLGAPGGLFSARLDSADVLLPNDGTGVVNPFNVPTTGGGSLVAPATVTVTFPGLNNDLTFTTTPPDTPANNGIQVIFKEVPGGPVAANLVGGGQMLIIDFDPGVTRANDIVLAMFGDPTFVVAPDPTDGAGGFPSTGLGLVSAIPVAATSGGSQILTGADVNPAETEGIFTTLLRLKAALEISDSFEIQRAIELLDGAVESMSFSRAELGARQQGLDVIQLRLEDENVDLQTAISDDLDADIVEVVSKFTGRQIAFEAALRSSAAIFQMTLLNYL